MDVIRTQRQVDDLLTAQCKRIFHGLPLTCAVKAHMMRVCETSCSKLNSQKALCASIRKLSPVQTQKKKFCSQLVGDFEKKISLEPE